MACRRLVICWSLFLLVHSKPLEYYNVNIGYVQQMTIEEQHTYVFNIDATPSSNQNYSSFVFQAHAEKAPVTMMNISKACHVDRECTTSGLHIGMVQLLSYPVNYTFNFSVDYFCSNCSNHTQELLVAVIGVPVYDPIPGGCSFTSALEIDPSLTLVTNQTSSMASIFFQNSDEGYYSRNESSEPLCSNQNAIVTTLSYEAYQKCYKNPTTGDVFYAIKSLLTPSAVKHDPLNFAFQSFKSGQGKRLDYVLRVDQVVIFNVLAYDKGGRSAAYVPSVARICDPGNSSPCSSSLSVPTMVCGPILGLIGLFLCFLGHRFFHAEVVLMSLLISCYVVFFILSVSTSWVGRDLVVGTVVLGLLLTALIFLLWFFSNWYMLFLMAFALSMSFLVTASILYTPLGNISLLRLWYIYMLAMLCGMLVFLLPFVCYPAVLNIVASSLVGSYMVIYCIGLFVGSYLNDIIMNVVNNAAVSGYLKSNGHCGLDVLDTVLSCAWVLLLVAGTSCQVMTELVRRAAFNKKERRRKEVYESNFRRFVKKRYTPFPTMSLFKQLRVSMRKRTDQHPIKVLSATQEEVNERRPLMSPNFAPRYHGSHLQ